MSKVTVNSITLGQSGTAANNFLIDTDAAGALRIRRNADGSGATVLNVDSSNRMSGTITQGTAINTTSGTSHDFTGIPSWAKKITVMLKGVSISGTSIIQLQIGSGSVDTTGYSGAAGGATNSGAAGTEAAIRTTGIPICPAVIATDVWDASVVLMNMGANVWVFSGVVTRTATAPYSGTCGGDKTLSGALDRVRLTTVNGTDTFDAGSVNVIYEG